MKRRLIALLLCIAMIGSMTVYAVGNEDVECPTCGNTNCSVVHGDTSAILMELLAINNLSDLLIEMCKEENLPALMAMPAREILVLEEHASVLYEGLEEPTEQETTDAHDILDMIYQLPNAPEMVTYNTEAPRKDVEDLVTDKKIVNYDPTTGKGTLTLEAYATGQSITTTTEKAVPTDIVLVLDQSNSMKDCICGRSQTNPCMQEGHDARIGALRTAANIFLDNVIAHAQQKNVDHRIAIVGFSDYDKYNSYQSTEVHTTTTGSTITMYDADKDPTNVYKNALQSASTQADSLRAAMSRVKADGGGTMTYAGLQMACNVFQNNQLEPGQKRNRVVILFTDGTPTKDGLESDGSYAIYKAHDLKASYGAKVYSVSVITDSDPDINKINTSPNKYLHFVSSNFPKAENMNSSITDGGDNGYYLSAKNVSDLTKIFQSISQDITTGGANIELGADAVLKDVLTKQFQLPKGATVKDIAVYTVNNTANGFDASTKMNLFATDAEKEEHVKITNNDDGTVTVTVTGFNYSENWVGTEKKGNQTTYRGMKLVVEIPFVVNPDFMGGNQVETNAPGSGVFDGDEVIEDFVSPKVDVDAKPLNFNDTVWNVYLKGDLTKEQLIDRAGIQAAIKKLADWQKNYVRFETIVVDSKGNVVTDISDLTEDEIYTVKVTTVPTGEGTAASAEAEQSAKVNVFMPHITFKDSAVNAGETPDYDDDNFVSLVWKHDDVESTDTTIKMTGTEPTLTYTYDPAAAPISNETNVKVTVTMNGDNIHDFVTFYREKCKDQDWSCDFDGGIVDAKDVNRINFIVHVKTFDLIIQKQGADADPDAAFVFNVKGKGVDMDVVIYGNGQVTIKDLPSGQYTISEKTGYWRYDLAADQTIDTAETAPVDGKVTTTFKNTLARDKWLDAIAHATNVFGSNS